MSLRIPDFSVSKFGGLNTAIKDIKTLKPGVSPDSLNWITGKYGDHIELRRGYARLGITEIQGNGRVNGIGIARRYDGVEIPYFSYGPKVMYYDADADDTYEVQTEAGKNLVKRVTGDELVVNGNFTGNANGWDIPEPSTVAYGTNNIVFTPIASTIQAISQLTIPLENYKWYFFSFVASGTGTLNMIAGDNQVYSVTNPSGAQVFAAKVSTIGNNGIQFTTSPDYNYNGTLDSVSVKEITVGEDVWFRPYQGLAGSFMYFGSQNTGTWKSPAANPASAVDQAVNNHRFEVFHIGQNRSFAGQRNGTTAGNNDKTGLYLSYIDKAQLSSFTQVSGESFGTGNGSSVTFTHSLTDITGVRTAMYVSVTDGTETFIDDRNGNMVGNLGGVGTVNYATGDVSVTFNTAPANLQAITCGYYHETSTTTGILDFSGSGNGQGKSFRQDDGGGKLMAIFNINTIEYCIHELKTWQFQSSLDDTESTNLPYRNIGIPYIRAADQSPEGILIIDTSRPTDPKFRQMEVLQGTNIQTIEPLSISDALDLSDNAFDYSAAFRWGDYRIFSCQEKNAGTANTFNSVIYIQNVISGAWDKLNYYASCFADYMGTLIAGDSISDNVYTLFSGFDEDGDVIENYWTSSDLNLGTDHLKNCRRMVVDGLIQSDQFFDVQISYDGGDFTTVYTVDGSGTYVDFGINTYIGGPTIGSKVIGGGGGTTAHPFEVDFNINSDRFIHARVRFVANGVGFLSVNEFTFKDIRDKGRKNLPVRTI